MSECLMPRGAKVQAKMKEENALKILNAPGASKNFYYNLVDWGVNNIVVIGLKEDVYYWDATKCKFLSFLQIHQYTITNAIYILQCIHNRDQKIKT